MSKQLYEEALADVKKLKEVAEDNAKRALLEAVTPRIKDLIETQLLGEMEVEDEDKLLLDDPEALDAPPVDPVGQAGDSDIAAAAISLPDEEGKVTLDLDALKVGSDIDEYELSMESAQKLGLLMNSSIDLVSVLNRLKKEVKLLSGAGKLVRESKGYADKIASTLAEVEKVYSYLQESNNVQGSKKTAYENLLEGLYKTLKQLTEQKMTRKNRTLSEADVTLKLTGLPDEVDLDSVGVDLITGEEEGEEAEGGEEGGDEDLDLGGEEEGGEEGEEGGDDDLDLDLGGDEGSEESEDSEEEKMESRRLSDNMVVEIDEGMLRREIAKMKALREADETKPQSWGHGPGDVSDDFEDEDMGDPFVDVDVTTESQDMDEADDQEETDEAKDMDEGDDLDEQDMDQLDMDQAHGEDAEHSGAEQPSDQSNEPGKTVESIRRRLAAEARLQTEAKKKAQQAKKQQAQKMKEAQQKAKQKKQKEAQQKKQQAKKMQEAYNFYARKFNESVARTSKLKGMLAEATSRNGRTLNGASSRSAAETNNLRTKLAETNLFNAKLLFTNKLLQNESLTKRQKAEVIERLDEARSEREVKLVYESLVKTLSSGARSMNESAERGVIGSSSRPARPAAASNTLNEGFEADRWARLAGIVK